MFKTNRNVILLNLNEKKKGFFAIVENVLTSLQTELVTFLEKHNRNVTVIF